MNIDMFKGYFLTVLSCLVLLAAAILVIGNAQNTGAFHLYVRNVPDFNMALLMLLSAAGGILIAWMFRRLIGGIRLIVAGRRRAAMDRPASAPPQNRGAEAPSERES